MTRPRPPPRSGGRKTPRTPRAFFPPTALIIRPHPHVTQRRREPKGDPYGSRALPYSRSVAFRFTDAPSLMMRLLYSLTPSTVAPTQQYVRIHDGPTTPRKKPSWFLGISGIAVVRAYVRDAGPHPHRASYYRYLSRCCPLCCCICRPFSWCIHCILCCW